jgi:hypothetical protein
MSRSNPRTLTAMVGVAMLIAACSSGGSTTPSGAAVASGALSGGGVSSIDPCKLLTPDEIKTALGIDAKAGVPQTTDTQVNCEWDSTDGSSSVGVTVAIYDDAVWQTLRNGANAKPISGFGDAAYTGFPHAGDIAIKRGGFEIDLGIVDFTTDTAKVDAADQSLATLVLSRI